MDVLKIEYETGRMELNIKMFFPCNLSAGKKIAALINRGCTEEDKSELLLELRSMAEGYQRIIQENKDTLKEFKQYYAATDSMARPNSDTIRHYEIEIRKYEALKKRVERNIAFIEQGEKNGKKKR